MGGCSHYIHRILFLQPRDSPEKRPKEWQKDSPAVPELCPPQMVQCPQAGRRFQHELIEEDLLCDYAEEVSKAIQDSENAAKDRELKQVRLIFTLSDQD